MAYLWDYVYYNEVLALPIWQKELENEHNPLTPYQPIVIDDGDYRGIYFCVVTNTADLYFWKWNWETHLLSEKVFANWNSNMRTPTFRRPLSFVSPDSRRAFIVANPFGGETRFAEVTPAIAEGLPPVYLGGIYTASQITLEPTVAYAGDATFACIIGTTLDARVFSWDNDFPPFTLARKIAPYQHGNKLTRPLILFTRTSSGGINAEAFPIIVYSDGTTKATIELDLPPAVATGKLVAALSPQHSGYDLFVWNLPTNWNFDTNIEVHAMDWVSDETAWIYIKKVTLPTVETPPEMSVLSGTYAIKHIAAVNLGATFTIEAFAWQSGYNYTYLTIQNSLFFADLAAASNYLCIFTPIGTAYIPNEPANFASISPATFHFERGCYYALVTYQNRVALFQIVHPQFFSNYFASVPAIQSISTDERYVIFIGRVTARYPQQHWSLAVVAMYDDDLRELVASTKSKVSDWEVWEVSHDGQTWVGLPSGNSISGYRWVRLKVPKSILEWKKDVFKERYPNRKWRLAFISEPVT